MVIGPRLRRVSVSDEEPEPKVGWYLVSNASMSLHGAIFDSVFASSHLRPHSFCNRMN